MNLNYEKIFNDLNIKVRPLPSEYTPDEYAKQIMRNAYSPEGVSYSVSTKSVIFDGKEF